MSADIDSSGYREFRTVLGHLPTGVTVITSAVDNRAVGMAVGTFASISLDPPLVGFFVARTSTTWPQVRASGGFCANVLGAGQEDLCRSFARSGGDKFAGVAWSRSASGRPRLAQVVAWVDCSIEQVCDAGDHELCIGRVQDLGTTSPEGLAGGPLIFYRGDFGALSEEFVGGSCP